MTLVDGDYCFLFIDVGANGRQSDGGVFKLSDLFKRLDAHLLNIPKGCVIVADDAFPLKKYFLKPYSKRELTNKMRIFNYRLSRARRVVENAFGILASRFRIFQKPICTKLDTTDKIVIAACSLHNWLRKSDHYSSSSVVNI